MDYVRFFIGPISGEQGLRSFGHDTVKNPVQRMVDVVYETPSLLDGLGLRETVTFESHTNLGNMGDSLSDHLHNIFLPDNRDGATPVSTAVTRNTRRAGRRRGKGNRAYQLYIYKTSNGRNIPAMAIEYKAPHKLFHETGAAFQSLLIDD